MKLFHNRFVPCRFAIVFAFLMASFLAGCSGGTSSSSNATSEGSGDSSQTVSTQAFSSQSVSSQAVSSQITSSDAVSSIVISSSSSSLSSLPPSSVTVPSSTASQSSNGSDFSDATTPDDINCAMVDVARGQSLFENRCATCHQTFEGTIAPGGINGTDPLDANQTTFVFGGAETPLLHEFILDNMSARAGGCDAECASEIAIYIKSLSNAPWCEAVLEIELPINPSGVTAFDKYFKPLTAQRCVFCHSETAGLQQAPLFAHSDATFAEAELFTTGKVNFSNPKKSRIVEKLSSLPLHNCGSSLKECQLLAAQMKEAISLWAAESSDSVFNAYSTLETPSQTYASAVDAVERKLDTSGAFIVYDFKDCEDGIIRDVSDVTPPLNLEIEGSSRCIPGQGIVNNINSSASQFGMSKIVERLRASQAFSIEFWMKPTSPQTLTLVSLTSGNAFDRTDMILRTRNGGIYAGVRDSNASPGNANNPLTRVATDQYIFPENALLHLVTTYDHDNLIRLYLNGNLLDYPNEGAMQKTNFDNWIAERFMNFLGDRAGWVGEVRHFAFYDSVIDQEKIDNNAAVFIQSSKLIRFDISDLVGTPNTAIQMNLKVLADKAYVFSSPTLIADDATQIDLASMRIAVNGNIVPTGQAFQDLKVENAVNGDVLSTVGALIEIDKGIGEDRFTLTFDEIAGNRFDRPALILAKPAPVADNRKAKVDGFKNFDQMNDSFAALTGVDKNTPEIKRFFERAIRVLPLSADVQAIKPPQQMAIANLAAAYCRALSADEILRATVYPNIDFEAPFSAAARSNLIDSLYQTMIGNGFDKQVTLDDVGQDLEAFIDVLVANGATTPQIVSGACTAVLASSISAVH